MPLTSNYCFDPSIFCPFGSDCPFYLAAQYWAGIFKGIGTLASHNLLVTFFCIFLFEKAGFKKMGSQPYRGRQACVRQEGEKLAGINWEWSRRR